MTTPNTNITLEDLATLLPLRCPLVAVRAKGEPGAGRVPVGNGWPATPVRDLDELREIFGGENYWGVPGRGVGLVGGALLPNGNRVIVVDIDNDPERGYYGPGELKAHEALGYVFPPTVAVGSGGGGEHRYYQYAPPADGTPRGRFLTRSDTEAYFSSPPRRRPPAYHGRPTVSLSNISATSNRGIKPWSDADPCN